MAVQDVPPAAIARLPDGVERPSIAGVLDDAQRLPRYMARHRVRAGITGWAQINGLRGNTSIPDRLKYDLYYVENWSFWLDIKILIKTILPRRSHA